MSKRSMLIAFCLIVFAVQLKAQEYIVQGSTPDLYLSHQVAAKETWYSISRNFGLQPKDIAAYNRLAITTPLEISQVVKIPLTPANFSQSTASGVPVYHVVGEKEWLYRVSVNHNKVPIEQLEKWNSISRDDAKTGMKLIVGYLTVKDVTPAVSQPVSSSNGGYFRSSYEERGKGSSGVAGIFKSTSGWSDGKYYALMNNVIVGTIIKIVYPQTNKTVFAKVLGELPDMKESAGLALRISDAAAKELGAATGKFSVDVRF